jgi:hypothetical protein
MDAAHKATDKQLALTMRGLRRLYKQSQADIAVDLDTILQRVYIDDSNATQRQRLDYADNNGKDKAIELLVNSLMDANEQAIEAINQANEDIYRGNYRFVINGILNHIRHVRD